MSPRLAGKDRPTVAVTVSGVAEWSSDPHEDMSRSLVRSDAGRYRARRQGGNRVVGAMAGRGASAFPFSGRQS